MPWGGAQGEEWVLRGGFPARVPHDRRTVVHRDAFSPFSQYRCLYCEKGVP